jgi:putative cell wall-binding protein
MAGLPAAAAEADPFSSAAPHRGLVITTDDGLAAAALAAAPVAGVDVALVAPRVAVAAVSAGQERALAAVLAGRAGVRSVEPDWLLRTAAVPDDPAYDEQWAHERTGMAAAWDLRTDARGARLAIIDTGIHAGHPDLAAQVTEQVDLSSGSLSQPPRRGVDNDPCAAGHGTWVAGVAAAAGDNGRDLAGAAWQADILDISVASKRSDASCDAVAMSRIIAGIDYAVHGTDRPARVVSVSMGGFTDGCPRALQAVVDQAWAAGTVVVASSGNGELDPSTAGQKSYPASCDHVVSVGATGSADLRAPYSTRNDAVDVVAPGGDATTGRDGRILTTNRDFGAKPTSMVQGTSFAAPYVAGVLAVLFAQRPDLGPAEVVSALLGTAKDLGLPGRDADYGNGLVRPLSALRALEDLAPAVPQPPSAPAPAPSASEPRVLRVSDGSGRTRAIEQAVAVSELAFPPGAGRHAVLARGDVFADALAGSALGMGEGPLLFSAGAGMLPGPTKRELARALPKGATVYVLGGVSALPAGVEDELRAMALRPVRLSGASREETAVAVAREAIRLRAALSLPRAPGVLLATRSDWPDAVAGGSLAAITGSPVLLTPRDALPASVEAFLRDVRPEQVTVLGGTGAVGAGVARAAADLAGARLARLAGSARDETAVAIGGAVRAALARTGAPPRYAVAVNLRLETGFAHALSASVLSGVFQAVLVPVEQVDGSVLTPAARGWVADELGDRATDVLLAGEPDVVAARVGEDLQTLMMQARAAQE